MSERERKDECKLHGAKVWVECENCGGDGMVDHDCGEDCCCCLDPEPNVPCDICRGQSGWYRCFTCAPETAAEIEASYDNE